MNDHIESASTSFEDDSDDLPDARQFQLSVLQANSKFTKMLEEGDVTSKSIPLDEKRSGNNIHNINNNSELPLDSLSLRELLSRELWSNLFLNITAITYPIYSHYQYKPLTTQPTQNIDYDDDYFHNNHPRSSPQSSSTLHSPSLINNRNNSSNLGRILSIAKVICLNILYLIHWIWYLIGRLATCLFILSAVGLTTYSRILLVLPIDIIVVNVMICIVSICQGVSLFAVVQLCELKLNELVDIRRNIVKYYHRAIPVTMGYYLVCVGFSVAFVSSICESEMHPKSNFDKLTFSTYYISLLAQLCIAALLATCLLLIVAENEIIAAELQGLVEQANDATLNLQTIDDVRSRLKKSLKETNQINIWMVVIAFINSAAFVVSIFFVGKVKVQRCIDSQNIFLLIATYFKEIVFLFLVLLSAARVNSISDRLTHQLGSSFWESSKELSRTVLYIHLVNRPLSVSISGFRPSYNNLALQIFGFVVATGIGIIKSLAEQSAG